MFHLRVHPDSQMYGYFLLNKTVTTEGGQKTNAWEAHRACMGKKAGTDSIHVAGVGKVDAGKLCDKFTYTDDGTFCNSVSQSCRVACVGPIVLPLVRVSSTHSL